MAENDIQELMQKCAEIDHIDPMWMLKLAFGRVSLEIIKTIVAKMNRVKLDIGDGLTLLHIAAQFNHVEWISYLVGEKNHPLEVDVRILFES